MCTDIIADPAPPQIITNHNAAAIVHDDNGDNGDRTNLPAGLRMMLLYYASIGSDYVPRLRSTGADD